MSDRLDKLRQLTSGTQYNRVAQDAPTSNFVPVADKQSNKELMLIGKINLLENEISSLRYDILTLLDLVAGEFELMKVIDAREAYSSFRADKNHLMNRITDKINNDIKITNDENEK